MLNCQSVAEDVVEATWVSVAQWIEHWFPVPKVAGSNPVGDTISAGLYYCEPVFCALRRLKWGHWTGFRESTINHMPRKYGYYEWDDGSLTPGQKKEGGWHQNLYDSDGHLKDHARFIPTENNNNDDDNDDYSEEDYSITTHVNEEERQSSEADTVIIDIAVLAAVAACYGAVVATPHIKRFWKEKVKPFFRSKVKGQKDQQHSVHHDLETIPVVVEEPTDSKVSSESPSTDMVTAKEQQTMSIDEAKARLILAAMGRAYSDEQLQMVINSHTIDADELEAVCSALMRLPRAELVSIFENMARNSQISEADLTALLKQIRQTEVHVIDNRQLPRSHTKNQLKRIDGDNS